MGKTKSERILYVYNRSYKLQSVHVPQVSTFYLSVQTVCVVHLKKLFTVQCDRLPYNS